MKSQVGIQKKLMMGLLWGLTIAGVTACSNPSREIASVEEALPSEASGIIGGEAVDEQDPVAASTVGIIDLKAGAVICTGSLIANNMVVTAAHCTSENPLERGILFSRKIPKTQSEAAQMQARRVVAGRTSPLWPRLKATQRADWGDIAVLRFVGEVPQGFKPAKLLTQASALKDGGSAIIAGFGITDGRLNTPTDQLLKTEVKFAQARFSSSEVLFDQNNKHGACHGDSGGPAFVRVGQEMLLFGVTSRGYQDPDDTCEKFAVYTNIVSYISWIRSTMASLNLVKKVEKIPQPAGM